MFSSPPPPSQGRKRAGSFDISNSKRQRLAPIYTSQSNPEQQRPRFRAVSRSLGRNRPTFALKLDIPKARKLSRLQKQRANGRRLTAWRKRNAPLPDRDEIERAHNFDILRHYHEENHVPAIIPAPIKSNRVTALLKAVPLLNIPVPQILTESAESARNMRRIQHPDSVRLARKNFALHEWGRSETGEPWFVTSAKDVGVDAINYDLENARQPNDLPSWAKWHTGRTGPVNVDVQWHPEEHRIQVPDTPVDRYAEADAFLDAIGEEVAGRRDAYVPPRPRMRRIRKMRGEITPQWNFPRHVLENALPEADPADPPIPRRTRRTDYEFRDNMPPHPKYLRLTREELVDILENMFHMRVDPYERFERLASSCTSLEYRYR